MATETAGAILTVDLGAVRRNYRAVRDHLGGAELAGVVKANAYGLGVDHIAPALAREGCRTFFVATAAEAFELRAILPETDIHVFNGIQPGEEDAFVAGRIVPVLNSLEQIETWRRKALASGHKLRADLHIDSGMSRLGLDAGEQRRVLARRPDHLGGIELDIVMSHLAVAEETGHELNARQLAAFRAVAPGLPGRRRSLANSSGAFLGRDYRFDLVRAGVALYGANPTPDAPNPVSHVVRLQGRILQVRSVERDQSVGYGATFATTRPSRIATVALGYADGYPLAMSNIATVHLGEHQMRVVGRMSMDLTTIDVTDLPETLAVPGQLVDFIGERNPVDAIAHAARTIPYAVMTGIGRRPKRVYLDEDADGSPLEDHALGRR